MQHARDRQALRGHRVAAFAIAFCRGDRLAVTASAEAAAGTLDRVTQAGKITLGYRTDARPFSYRDESGNADRLLRRAVPEGRASR